MNPTTDEQATAMPSWYDPFQEIRTMPKGWDLSSLLERRPAAPQPARSPNHFDGNEDTKGAARRTSLP